MGLLLLLLLLLLFSGGIVGTQRFFWRTRLDPWKVAPGLLFQFIIIIIIIITIIIIIIGICFEGHALPRWLLWVHWNVLWCTRMGEIIMIIIITFHYTRFHISFCSRIHNDESYSYWQHPEQNLDHSDLQIWLKSCSLPWSVEAASSILQSSSQLVKVKEMRKDKENVKWKMWHRMIRDIWVKEMIKKIASQIQRQNEIFIWNIK